MADAASPFIPATAAPAPLPSVVVELETDVPDAVTVKDGAVEIEQPDGSVVIDFAPKPKAAPDDGKWFTNLATKVDAGRLGMIAEEMLTAIDADEQTRSEWVSQRTRTLELLGLKLEPPRNDVSNSSAPLEGMSSVRHPVLLEAVLRFQANARGELLPASGPAKIDNQGRDSTERDELAEDLEKEFNNYLTTTASEYYPDTDAMLFSVGAGGAEFKKVYHCPLRDRPVSEWVNASDIIVNNTATDLRNAERITHRTMIAPSTMARMQKAGQYRDIALSQPNEQPDQIAEKKANISGVAALPTRPEDQRHTVYETYTRLDLTEYAPRGFKGQMLPFKISIDRDSRQVLELRRNWDKDDDLALARTWFVKFPYVRAFGFYDIGLGNILGNSAAALTAGWRIGLDNGMFSNFPGFLYNESAGRQLTNQIRVPPGGGMRIQTGQQKIGDAVMALPYKAMDPSFVAFLQWMESDSQRVGGTAEVGVGEGKQNAPVGTTLALIEQATMVLSAVQKRLHQAQGEEFQLLQGLFRDDPEAMWRSTPERKRARPWNEALMLKALGDYDLVARSDPDSPGHLQRMMRAQALLQMAKDDPVNINQRLATQHALSMMNFDASAVMNPPSSGEQQPSDAQVLAQAQLETAKVKAATDLQANQIKAASALAANEEKAKDREFKKEQSEQDLAIKKLQLASELAVHPTSLPVVQQVMP